MGTEGSQFKLRCQLQGHEDDVRGIGICGDDAIATASRDKSVRYWLRADEQAGGYTVAKTLVGHTNFVGSVCWIPPNEALPLGGLVSGGMDSRVLVWNLETASVAQDLRGHQQQVTSVAVDRNGDIVSASVDSTVCRWKNGQVAEVLRGHQGPVQCTLVLPSGDLLTGSSDTTIKLWRGASCVKTFSGHADTVRDLAVIPNIGVLSASHDGTIKLWSFEGDQLLELVGHTAIVYSVAAHSSGLVASGSEDGYAKLWKGALCVQSIEHPGCVWDVQFLSNGDIVTACSDGVARVWTQDPHLSASPEDVESYEALLLARKTQRKTVGGVTVGDLPGLEALQHPGNKDGQTKIIREGDHGVAYTWNKEGYKWDKIGEVVDGPTDGLDKKMLNGVTYDFVFDVDIGDGEPTRKLPFNRGENPYEVADRWLMHEDLPLAYRQQVVEFILQNTGQAPPRFDPAFFDPYTGANAYVPPLQQPGTSTSHTNIANQDQSHAYTLKHVPKKGMLYFDTAQYDGIYKKLLDFIESFVDDETKKTLVLNEGELIRIQAVLSTLKETSRYHSSTFADVDFRVVSKLLLQWPTSKLFPALDLLKMLLLHPYAAGHYAKEADTGKDLVIDALRRATTEPVISANLLTSARVVANCFRHSSLRKWAIRHRSEILDLFSECCTSQSKFVRLAFATVVLNYSVLMVEIKDEGGQIQALSAAVEMAGPHEQEAEVQFRALVAVGTLIHGGRVKSVAVDMDVSGIVDSAANSPVTKISEVGKDIQFLLK